MDAAASGGERVEVFGSGNDERSGNGMEDLMRMLKRRVELVVLEQWGSAVTGRGFGGIVLGNVGLDEK